MSSAIVHPGGSEIERTLGRYFEVALYLLVVTAFLTLAATQELDNFSISFVSLALLLRGYLLARKRSLLLPERWTSTATIAYVAFYLLDYFFLSGQFVATTVHLVLFLMVLRLFSARKDRDNYFLAVIAFLMVLAAAVLTVDSIFLLAFCLFLLAAVVTFILMEMKRTASRSHASSLTRHDDVHDRQLAMSLSGVAPAILVLILVAASLIFFILPRSSNSYLNVLASSGAIGTGFSDRVDLGAIGEIQQSSTVVMHVEIEGDNRGVYIDRWRGIALSDFDGTGWSNPARPRPLRPMGNLFDLRSHAVGTQLALPQSLGARLHYHVLMEPVGVNVFFLARNAQLLEGKYRVIGKDSGDAVFNLDTDRAIGVYDAWSSLDIPPSRPGRDYQVEGEREYLGLPRLDSRIPQLARQITAGADNNYARAQAIEHYLQSNFGYTLQLPRTRPRDPLAHFLFDRRSGHCEYFASSMAVMLRTLFIPSRVITGFRGGEFNDLTGQYIIRAKDAHAWVEAYFPDRGWVTFDPTPASSAVGSGGWGRVGMYLDAMATFWREWVVNYDSAHQNTLGQDAARRVRRRFDSLKAWAQLHYRATLRQAQNAADAVAVAPKRWAIGSFLAVLLLTLAFNLRGIWQTIKRMRLAAHPERSPQRAASLWYQRMVRRVSRRGWHKRETQTPAEFARSIADDPLRANVLEFTRHYENARFGDSAEDARRLPELYEEIASKKR